MILFKTSNNVNGMTKQMRNSIMLLKNSEITCYIYEHVLKETIYCSIAHGMVHIPVVKHCAEKNDVC